MRRALRGLTYRTVSASIAIHPTATPAAAPSTNQRRTGCVRQSQSVGANPPTATTFSPTDTSGFTRVIPILSTTMAAAVTAATKAATVRPVPQGVESSSDTASG